MATSQSRQRRAHNHKQMSLEEQPATKAAHATELLEPTIGAGKTTSKDDPHSSLSLEIAIHPANDLTGPLAKTCSPGSDLRSSLDGSYHSDNQQPPAPLPKLSSLVNPNPDDFIATGTVGSASSGFTYHNEAKDNPMVRKGLSLGHTTEQDYHHLKNDLSTNDPQGCSLKHLANEDEQGTNTTVLGAVEGGTTILSNKPSTEPISGTYTDNLCHIDRLPVELLSIILKFVAHIDGLVISSSHHRAKNGRLVLSNTRVTSDLSL
jgi:hypothetical protein